MPYPLLHHDHALVIISKPAGVMVHRGMGCGRDEVPVLQELSAQLGAYLYPVHRLDRNTSGALCFGLTSASAAAIQAALREGRTTKEYLVLVRRETPEHFVSERPLTVDGTKRDARTEFTRLAVFSRCSLLRARPFTGRLHQIRRHLAHLAHQVIGDTSHGKGRINQWFRTEHGLPRMFLHASRLALPHPETGAMIDVVDPLPDDLWEFLKRLPDVDVQALASLVGREAMGNGQ